MLIVILLFFSNLIYGPVKIPFSDILGIMSGGEVENDSWSFIIESRLNRSLVAIAGGGALAIAGLILQVFFRNPLAGPGVLGITSGASLGVAIVLLGGMSYASVLGSFSVIMAGIIGALLVLFLLLFISRFIYNAVTLLVVGLMFGYFTSAFINVLFLWANQSDTREFVIWGLGSFEGLSTPEMGLFLVLIISVFLISLLLVKPLNALVLGGEYAKSLGVNIKRTKMLIILTTGVLAAIVTVYCGPISFVGIAVPQIIRLIIKSKNHLFIIPITFIAGGILAIFADLIVRFSDNSLPLNTVTAIIGAPVIIYTIIKLNRNGAGV